jgi:putative hydrolase of the HAD superfamily
MVINKSENSVFIFDLDDTLYSEYDYVCSAFSQISEYFIKLDQSIYHKMISLFDQGQNVFEYLIKNYPNVTNDKEYLLTIYRNHIPQISLNEEVKVFLRHVEVKKYKKGLLTDGRSVTQRNKILSLGLSKYFDLIVISEEFGSEKPSVENYRAFECLSKSARFIYVGDNPSKDFVAPNSLGWLTVCAKDNGRNIHKQDFTLPDKFLPKVIVRDFSELMQFA